MNIEILVKAGVDMITINEVLIIDGKGLDEMIMDEWGCSFPFQRLVISSNGIILLVLEPK